MDDGVDSSVPCMDNITLKNLADARYKISVTPLLMRATSLVSLQHYLFVGMVNIGMHIFQYSQESLWPLHKIGAKEEMSSGRMSSRVRSAVKHCDGCISIYDITVDSQHVVYFMEEGGKTYLCVHKTSELLSGKLKPQRMLETKRRAPMVVDAESGHVIIGGAAWTTSWMSDTASNIANTDVSAGCVRVLDLATFDTLCQFDVAEHAIGQMREHVTPHHHMLAVADTRAGIKVFDLRQPTTHSYACLYQLPVDEVRNFHLVGNFIGVFHKFEPNVSLWNVLEQKTILCINIQEQMRELCEQFAADEEDDDVMYDDAADDDHVTAVCSVATSDDAVLIYGTRSGCVFGMSVSTRRKLFNIPCPFGSVDGPAVRAQVQGATFLPGGRLAVAYDRQGLTVLDFGLADPPDRPPPTRHMRRPMTT